MARTGHVFRTTQRRASLETKGRVQVNWSDRHSVFSKSLSRCQIVAVPVQFSQSSQLFAQSIVWLAPRFWNSLLSSGVFHRNDFGLWKRIVQHWLPATLLTSVGFEVFFLVGSAPTSLAFAFAGDYLLLSSFIVPLTASLNDLGFWVCAFAVARRCRSEPEKYVEVTWTYANHGNVGSSRGMCYAWVVSETFASRPHYSPVCCHAECLK